MDYNGEDYRFLKIKDAILSINQKVSFVGVILEVGSPKQSKGTDSKKFLLLREIKDGQRINMACKLLKVSGWPLFGMELMLHQPRSVRIGSILRVIIDKGIEKHILHLLKIGKWVKLQNVLCQVDAGLWFGVLTHFTRLRYVPTNDNLIVERQRSYDERLSWEHSRMPYWCFPWTSEVTDIDYSEDGPFVTLKDVLTHSQVTAKFKCVVRVVAALPWRSEDFCSPLGHYRIRLTLEDPTARIHAFVYAEDGEKLFGGYPFVDVLKRKINKLLGVAVSDGQEIKDAPRNPPWVQCCLKSYYIDRNDIWGSRQYRIFDTKISG
ncbi:protection of telomeres protein 1b [Citrus sinensis]|uniref:Protection of telomeres protein 1b n=1 Tax=Citrus sinensis TaxID=2711 RepID=A0ACB8NU24_CITSI|nr:protection of telomeres protein 1b [Citrus sinensis]